MADGPWTLEAWIEHTRELRAADLRALQIADAATENALTLAREAQHYRDEQANNLRLQIETERGNYLTRDEYVVQHSALSDKIDAGFSSFNAKFEATVDPLVKFVAAAQGARTNTVDARSIVYGVLALILAAAAIVSPHIH